MLVYTTGDLFESPAKVLVNPVNTKGVMGRGIALKFKRIYPEMFKAYRNHCERGELTIGKLYLYKSPHKWILNFPTKTHWRDPSKVEYIEAGLCKLQSQYTRLELTSIAFPKLGSGNGGLDFDSQVMPIMERHLKGFSVPTFVHIDDAYQESDDPSQYERTASRLRSAPAAMPFDEIWQDLLGVLDNHRHFTTYSNGTRYSAMVARDHVSLTIRTDHKSMSIFENELHTFWQQLRDFGLTHAGISPAQGLTTYLLPVFATLPYIKHVHLSRSIKGMRSNPSHGVQVIPPPSSNQSDTSIP